MTAALAGLLAACAKPESVSVTTTTVGRSAVIGTPAEFVSSNGVLTLEPATTTTTTLAPTAGVCSRSTKDTTATSGATTTTTTTTTVAPTTTAAGRRATTTTTTTTVPEGMPGEVVVVGGPSASKVAASLARRLKPLAVRTDATTDVVRALALLNPKPNALVFLIDVDAPASHAEYVSRLAAVCGLAEHLVWVASWRPDRDAWAGAVRASGADVLDLDDRLERQPTWVAPDGALTDLGAVAVAAMLEPEARSPLP